MKKKEFTISTRHSRKKLPLTTQESISEVVEMVLHAQTAQIPLKDIHL